ncbi:MAG: DJ-1/PfpI family protein [Fimbriiglobus sp.]|jgi:protease I|nr:DJ-1/PfpI family protein [Fimbriiglobus sp.]
MRALILLADGFDDLTLFLPWYRLKEEGWDVALAAPLMTAATGRHGYTVEPDMTIQDVNTDDFDLLIIPDGSATEKVRLLGEAVDVARTLMQEGKVVAAIGHGAQLLISAGALDARTVTCSPGIRDDVRAAGALYRDDSTILDGNLLTCRGSDDLPEFSRRLVALLKSPTVVRA